MEDFKEGPVEFKGVKDVFREAKKYCDKCCNYRIPEETFELPYFPEEEGLKLSRLLKHFMIAAFSVLDYAYYYLSCKIQNKGEPSYSSKVQQVPMAINPSLEYSMAPDMEKECKKVRDKWADDSTKNILGTSNDDFAKNVLSFQVLTQVDSEGAVVEQGTVGVVRQETAGDVGTVGDVKQGTVGDVTPINVLAGEAGKWHAATAINVLHFYRNFVVHRDFMDIMVFPPEKVYKILVPDLRRTSGQEKHEPTMKFELKPLPDVLQAIYKAVEKQMNYLELKS